MQHTATRCNTENVCSHYTLGSRIIILSVSWKYNTLCNTLQHTAAHCNTLQHTATRCNTLQHAATLRICVLTTLSGPRIIILLASWKCRRPAPFWGGSSFRKWCFDCCKSKGGKYFRKCVYMYSRNVCVCVLGEVLPSLNDVSTAQNHSRTKSFSE